MSNSSSTASLLCTVDDLQRSLSQADAARPTVVLDGSWHMPATKRDAKAEFLAQHIPTARRFDIDAIADRTTTLPHMLPSAEHFADSVGALGISNDHHVVVYDDSTVYSAFRVYWMFRVFGHDRVSVLNGGLPAWRRASYPVAAGEAEPPAARANFSATLRPEMLVSYDQLRAQLAQQPPTRQILDARGAKRFAGEQPEPRAGVRSGHMPGAYNLPYAQTMDEATHTMLPPEQLRRRFADLQLALDRPIITSCGSGVTACVLYAALQLAGAQQVAVYDGSWTEYGSRPESEVHTGSQSSSSQ